MPAPLLLMVLPLLLAPVTYLVHGRRVLTGMWLRVDAVLTVSVAVALALLALLALGLPLDERLLGGFAFKSVLTVMGRTFVMEPADRVGVAFIFGLAAVLFGGAAFTRPGRFYLPMGLAVLGLLAGALFVRPFVFAALFIELAAALAVFMLGDETHPQTRGAWRFLLYLTLGMPFILLTGWLLEGSAASPPDATFTLVAMVGLGIGFAALLAVAPFHSWLPVVAEHAPPLASAFVLTVMQSAAVFLLMTFLRTYPWLGQNPLVYRVLTLTGGGLVLVGAVFALGQKNLGRVMGYAMLVDTGAVLLAIGLGTPEGIEVALAVLTLRGLALFVWGMGLDQLRRAVGRDDFETLRGVGREYPFAAAAVLLGLLSLAGFPLTAGFPARWALLRLLAQIHPSAAILLLVGMASLAVVVVRGLTALIIPRDGQTDGRPKESFAVLIICGVTLVVCLILGFFPQWVLPAVANAAQAFISAGP